MLEVLVSVIGQERKIKGILIDKEIIQYGNERIKIAKANLIKNNFFFNGTAVKISEHVFQETS